ncbi:MAG: N-acetyl-gamma-glutamyl-phosphate reductase [Spirochaetes bacterium]|nr:N-acetyl-gamma-glutamyl-phosphate reductase [Spirochaetota bacterium]
MSDKIRVKIIGATGYGGVGAVELLSKHPNAEIVSLHAVADVGKRIDEIYPHLSGLCDLVVEDAKKDTGKADVVFFSTPDGVGMTDAKAFVNAGSRVIDYSGDFRFNNENDYAAYASRIGRETTHKVPDLLPRSAYGVPELHRSDIAKATIVGNAGCFAMSAILGSSPALKHKLIDPSSLIFDAKSGVSGAGKKPNPIHHFPHRYEEMNAYKIGAHQHVMEVERELSAINGNAVAVTFTAQVLPIVRGIMTVVYGSLLPGVTYDKVFEAYNSFYKDEPFVQVYGEKKTVGNRTVRGTNKCALWINVDRRTNKMIIVSHIDNLLKGQAGNAVQCMNIMFGLPETAGLSLVGMYP